MGRHRRRKFVLKPSEPESEREKAGKWQRDMHTAREGAKCHDFQRGGRSSASDLLSVIIGQIVQLAKMLELSDVDFLVARNARSDLKFATEGMDVRV